MLDLYRIVRGRGRGGVESGGNGSITAGPFNIEFIQVIFLRENRIFQ